MPFQLSRQWLCGNSFTWEFDARLHIASSNERRVLNKASKALLKVLKLCSKCLAQSTQTKNKLRPSCFCRVWVLCVLVAAYFIHRYQQLMMGYTYIYIYIYIYMYTYIHTQSLWWKTTKNCQENIRKHNIAFLIVNWP